MTGKVASAPPASAELETRFADYFRQMTACRDNGLGWALAHLVLVMPDVCAAMASETGWARPDKYVAWCDRYVADARLTGADWRVMRDIVLHQGRTAPQQRQGAQYSNYVFEAPEGTSHKQLTTGAVQSEIRVNVGRLLDELTSGMRRWFADVARGDETAGAAHVRSNLEHLVRVKTRAAVEVALTSVPQPASAPRPVATTASQTVQDTYISTGVGLKRFPPGDSNT